LIPSAEESKKRFVKKIVGRDGGMIAVESAPGEGTPSRAEPPLGKTLYSTRSIPDDY
jgi:hypothetical protein